MPLIPTILCGGAGSRLWPVSRELHPKPFIRLADGQSLLQKAFLRGAALPGAREVLTVTHRELFFKAEDEYRGVNQGRLATSYILEPSGRNTGAAIAAAALRVAAEHGSDALMLVLAADHLIGDAGAFGAAVERAGALAREGWLVALGVEPDAPETGYGYIEAEDGRVARFVEKPTPEKARDYLACGRFLWNTGIFCFQAGAILDALREHAPQILAATRACVALSRSSRGEGFSQLELDAASFALVPEQSLECAVMERSQRVAVVPCAIGWRDIGSWSALGELTGADARGNRVDGEALLHDVDSCYIQSDKRVIGAVGVANLIVVDTPDALLIADKARAQDVRHLYAALKVRGHAAHKRHLTMHRPWGSYTVLEEDPAYKIKRIEVRPGAALSLQMHHHRNEHWIVVAGMARVLNGEREFFVNTNESTYIPAGHRHRLENPGLLDLVMIEVQSGQYLGEDDIVRFEDHYGRA